MLGNVSGGCLDAAVYEACRQMLVGDSRPKVVRFGYSDGDALAVGLTCGGTIELILRHHDPRTGPGLAPAFSGAAQDKPVAVATIGGGPSAHVGRMIVVRPGRPSAGTLGSERLDQYTSTGPAPPAASRPL